MSCNKCYDLHKWGESNKASAGWFCGRVDHKKGGGNKVKGALDCMGNIIGWISLWCNRFDFQPLTLMLYHYCG